MMPNRRPDTKEHKLYHFIYTKFQNWQKECVGIEIQNSPPGPRVEGLSGDFLG